MHTSWSHRNYLQTASNSSFEFSSSFHKRDCVICAQTKNLNIISKHEKWSSLCSIAMMFPVTHTIFCHALHKKLYHGSWADPSQEKRFIF
jgi:hypothetical protein